MKRKLLLLCIPLLFLTGCSNLTQSSGTTDLNPKKIHINFQAFAKTDTDEVNTTSVPTINMDSFTTDELVKLKQIVSTIYDTLGNYQYVLDNVGNTRHYYEKTKDYYTDDFYQLLINGNNNYILNTITNIYQLENCGYYKTNIIEIKKEKNNEFKVFIQVLAIQNNETLYGETDILTFTNDYKISNIEQNTTLQVIQKSTTPLTEDNINETNKNFEKKLGVLLSSISNKYIYKNYYSLEHNTIEYKSKAEKIEKEKEINLQIKTLLEKDNLDINTLKELFLIGEGTFENYGIVNYSLKNEENTEESIYKVGFVHNKKIYYFNFTYSRLLDEITNIEKCEK